MRPLLACLVPALALLVSTGCIPSVPEGFEDELTTVSGCGDATFFGVNDDDTLMLLVRATGLVKDAFDRGADSEYVFDLPDVDLRLSVQVGQDLSTGTCTDVIDGDGPITQATWVPQSGTVTIRVRPGATYDASRADMILTDATFVRETSGGSAVTVDRFEILDLPVGWFPG
ncbi:MAG: hypothetical protein H6733_15140 [Alphaproteobacteria bacterium]|nr:hypothetical protein [Alphaproteobacteria bacterium]